jgi:CubicO group peptidase (beta-lactamase class C family)
MSALNTILNDAVSAGDVPFVVAMTGNSSDVTWSGVAGDRAAGVATTEDTVFRIFSMTKAVGSTAAMILIDRGKLNLDTPIEEILPQFADIKLLDGFDGDTPRLRAPKKMATVRQLATHTSGFVYEFWNTDIPKYMEATEHPTIISGLKTSLYYPLVFEPGECWDYGIGIDWLGQIVEAVDGRCIDAFCREEIFDPLGMPDTNFEVTGNVANRLATVQARGEDGQFVDFELAPPPTPEFYGMGHALYSTAPDYMRFVRMFLNKGQLDGSRILSEAGVETMLANHIGDLRVGKLTTVAPPITADVEFFPGFEKSHSLGFMRMEEDVPEMRAAGSQSWAGVLNTHFWFDPARDVAALIMTQTLPFLEPRFSQLYERFERAVYATQTRTNSAEHLIEKRQLSRIADRL